MYYFCRHNNENGMKVFHGSNIAIEKPSIRATGYYKDFGYGFYCTKMETQAKRWASTKQFEHVVSIYEYTPNYSLNVLTFTDMTEEWLDFIVACRTGVPHTFDIVEGPMADDTIWSYVEDFIAGGISREAFWVLSKFKHPTHQVVYCTDIALGTLTFIKSYKV